MTLHGLTLWPHWWVTIGGYAEASLDDVFHMLARPVDSPDKNSLPGWSPMQYAGNKRAKENIVRAHGTGLDVDGGNLPIEAVIEPFAHLFGHVHSTASSKPNDRRWRVFLPFAEAVEDVSDVERVTRYHQRLAPGKVDTGTKDASRFWFRPWIRSTHWEHARLDGYLLDAKKIANEEREREGRERRERESKRFEPVQAITGGTAKHVLEKARDAMQHAGEGDRHKTLNASAYAVGRFVGAKLMTKHDAFIALDAASRGKFPEEREKERVRTINDGLDAGIANPRKTQRTTW